MYKIVAKDKQTGGIIIVSPAPKWLLANNNNYKALAKKLNIDEYKLMNRDKANKLDTYASYDTLEPCLNVLRASLTRDIREHRGLDGPEKGRLIGLLKATDSIDKLLEIKNDCINRD